MMEATSQVQGTCMVMCSDQEIRLREREGLIHVLEASQYRKGSRLVADRRKMVKIFTRSAAGREMSCPDELRPPPILKKTVNYLLGSVVVNSEVAWPTVYTFITDRLRAVRQDMVIQAPPQAVCATILEPIVRFHAYAAYRLCEEPHAVFDPYLNQTQLNETLKQLLVCYDSMEVEGEGRDHMEALYGLLHLGNVDALYRMLSLRPARKSALNIALRMSIADFHNDYIKVCRLLHHLPLLLLCVASLNLPHVRRRALLTMNCAYSSKNLRYPVGHLTELLAYQDTEEAKQECQHYGINVDDNGVHFFKSSFQPSIKESSPKRLNFIDERLTDVDLPDLLLTATPAEPER